MFLPNLFFRSHLNRREKIYYVAHVHPFLIYKQLFKIICLGILLPLILYLLFPPFQIISFIWGGMGIIYFFYEIFNWYLDAWLITSTSILDIRWDNPFRRSVTRIDHHGVEEVAYTISGFWGTIMNFGTIEIKKLGSFNPVVFQNIAFPRKVEKAILKYQAQFVQEKAKKDHETLKTLLTDMLQHQSRKR